MTQQQAAAGVVVVVVVVVWCWCRSSQVKGRRTEHQEDCAVLARPTRTTPALPSPAWQSTDSECLWAMQLF
jgi:hypothetical protein